MKTLNLITAGTLCLVALGCSTAAEPPMGAAGSPPATGGSGGAAATGGSDNSAGASQAGVSASAGVGNSGGSTAAGAGGAGGSSSSAGAGGAAAGSGGAAPVVDVTLAKDWDGALLKYPCGDGNPNYDCKQPTTTNCKNATPTQAPTVIKPADNAKTTWTMGGTPGTIYDVKVHIRGVVEPSWYHGGERAAGNNTSISTGSKVPGAQSWAKDLFQTGGTTLVYGDDSFDYNQYELTITPPGGQIARYFLNSVNPNEKPGKNAATTHLSFEIDEMPTLKIAGGSTISLTVSDSNCVQIQNCGTSNNDMCGNGARNVPLNDADPKPQNWNGKVTSGAGGNLNGQFVHFDVVSVTVAQ